MDMAAKFQDQFVFHMTGKRSGAELDGIGSLSLRPAHLAAYRDLTRLRYDFPLLLTEDPAAPEPAVPLSALVNRLLAELAPRGTEGERLRRLVLRLEREIRVLVGAGESGSLSELWSKAAERIAGDEEISQVLAHAAKSLKTDGALIDCTPELAPRLLTHAWRVVHAKQARDFRALVDDLVRKCSDILRAAYVRSEAGQRPLALRAAVGAFHADSFDFDAMSRLVGRGVPKEDLPPARRQRIEHALAVLRSQRFYPDPKAGGVTPFEFCFEHCAAAAAAYRERLPAVVDVVKAIAIAELEARGRYDEQEHDPFFERYDLNALTTADLTLFPAYLVCIPAGRNDVPENAALIDMLSSGLPVKVAVMIDDLIEPASIGTGHFAFGVRGARLATTAMGLGGMFVLQSPGSNLPAMRERCARGMSCPGPALFCVYPGTAASDLPAYLSAAASMESRAFPAFTYDAQAGANWAERFSLEANRDPHTDWPVDRFEYADEAMQRNDQPLAFTFADFVLCDRRYADHFALVPRSRWNASMLPVAEWLALGSREVGDRVPYLLAVDDSNVLHRVIVDARLMQATRRALLLWHRLQEHAGIHDSHAQRLLAREKAEWQAQLAAAAALAAAATPASPQARAAGAATVETTVTPGSTEEPAASAKPPSDEPWIETARCPSCGECTAINDRMFAYNENKQAYFLDVNAGTYRQLVEAAEVCQVAIIHPGKPRNPNEPGLAELIERAQPFQ